jgi:Sigma-70, region 4
LRETFILHLESELSYQDIVEQLNISYDNVRKRISQARAILRQRFNENFSEDGESRVSPQSAKPRKLKKTAPEPVAGEMALSGELEEVQIVAGRELPEAVELVLVEAESDEKLEEIEIVADGEPQSAALSVPQRETLEPEERMKGEKPSFFSCSNEILAFPSPSQSAIPLLRIASPCALKQLLIWVALAWSSKISASLMQETWFLRLLTRGARIVNKEINSS